MKTYFVAIATLFIFSIPSLSSAADYRPGPYFSAFLGASFARDTTVDSINSTGNTFSDQVTFDPGIYVGGTGGYDFGFVRLEGELSYRGANIDTVTQIGPIPEHFRNVDGDLGVFAAMGNVFLNMHNPSRVTPYLGGGIGFATLHLSATDGYSPTQGRYVPLYNDSNDTVFAYQVGAGMDIALNSRYSLDIGYRYFATEKAKFDSDYATTSEFRFESHNAMVGFKFKF